MYYDSIDWYGSNKWFQTNTLVFQVSVYTDSSTLAVPVLVVVQPPGLGSTWAGGNRWYCSPLLDSQALQPQ